LGLVDHDAWHPLASTLLMALAGAGYGVGFSPVVTSGVARVPLVRARDASGILTTTIQVSYAAGLTSLGSLFLSRAHVDAGTAFTDVSLIFAALSGAAAVLAARLARGFLSVSAAKPMPRPEAAEANRA
jgi:hypothetical protein